MKTFITALATIGTLFVYFGEPTADGTSRSDVFGHAAVAARSAAAVDGSERVAGPSDDLIAEYCVRCHNDRRLRGNLSLELFDAASPSSDALTAEKMIVKLRAGMMPPPGTARPPEDSLAMLAADLEVRIDAAAALAPDPGGRTFQRLNRAEYERSVYDLLGIEVEAGEYLPLDTKSENFDNIADVQMLSPTLLDAYLSAAADISRLAVGDLEATPSEKTYTVSGYTSQRERVDGAPFGTRGGMSITHNFSADGEYVVAFASDMTRVFSFKTGRDASGRVFPGSGTDRPFHPASHHGGKEEAILEFNKINQYHVSMLPYFLEQLQAIDEGETNLLEKTMIVYGSPMADANLHNHRRCPFVVLGGANGQLEGGLHLKAPDGTPMANVMLSLLHRLGIDDLESFGDSTGEFSLTTPFTAMPAG